MAATREWSKARLDESWMEPFARSIDKAKKYVDLKLINQREFSSGAVALKNEP
jgi:hypothetical protein